MPGSVLKYLNPELSCVGFQVLDPSKWGKFQVLGQLIIPHRQS